MSSNEEFPPFRDAEAGFDYFNYLLKWYLLKYNQSRFTDFQSGKRYRNYNFFDKLILSGKESIILVLRYCSITRKIFVGPKKFTKSTTYLGWQFRFRAQFDQRANGLRIDFVGENIDQSGSVLVDDEFTFDLVFLHDAAHFGQRVHDCALARNELTLQLHTVDFRRLPQTRLVQTTDLDS